MKRDCLCLQAIVSCCFFSHKILWFIKYLKNFSICIRIEYLPGIKNIHNTLCTFFEYIGRSAFNNIYIHILHKYHVVFILLKKCNRIELDFFPAVVEEEFQCFKLIMTVECMKTIQGWRKKERYCLMK